MISVLNPPGCKQVRAAGGARLGVRRFQNRFHLNPHAIGGRDAVSNARDCQESCSRLPPTRQLSESCERYCRRSNAAKIPREEDNATGTRCAEDKGWR